MFTHNAAPCDGRPMTWIMRHARMHLFAGVVMLLLVPVLISCSTPGAQKASADAAKGQNTQDLRQAGPAPGDTRIANGVEYIYGHNVRFGYAPDEPEYAWIPRQDYKPDALETQKSDPAREKEMRALQERLKKLEAAVKEKNSQ